MLAERVLWTRRRFRKESLLQNEKIWNKTQWSGYVSVAFAFWCYFCWKLVDRKQKSRKWLKTRGIWKIRDGNKRKHLIHYSLCFISHFFFAMIRNSFHRNVSHFCAWFFRVWNITWSLIFIHCICFSCTSFIIWHQPFLRFYFLSPLQMINKCLVLSEQRPQQHNHIKQTFLRQTRQNNTRRKRPERSAVAKQTKAENDTRRGKIERRKAFVILLHWCAWIVWNWGNIWALSDFLQSSPSSLQQTLQSTFGLFSNSTIGISCAKQANKKSEWRWNDWKERNRKAQKTQASGRSTENVEGWLICFGWALSVWRGIGRRRRGGSERSAG